MNVVFYYFKWCIVVDYIYVNWVDIKKGLMRKLDIGYNCCKL